MQTQPMHAAGWQLHGVFGFIKSGFNTRRRAHETVTLQIKLMWIAPAANVQTLSKLHADVKPFKSLQCSTSSIRIAKRCVEFRKCCNWNRNLNESSYLICCRLSVRQRAYLWLSAHAQWALPSHCTLGEETIYTKYLHIN